MKLGTWRWVVHCVIRHPFGRSIAVTPQARYCPCGNYWTGR